MSRRSVVLLVSLLLLSGPILIAFLTQAPGQRLEATLMRKWTPPEDVTTVQRWVEWLRDGKFDQIEREIDPSLRTDDVRDKLKTMAGFLPAQQPRSVKPIGYLVVNHRDSSRTVTATLEYEFPDRWLVATLVRQEQSGTSTVTGFHVYPIPESVESHNRFTLSGKEPAHLVVLLLAFASLGVSIYGVVACLRAPMGRKRWLWAFICLVGAGRLAINWTTGAIGFTLAWIGFPPSGAAMVPLYSPWMVYTSLPVGAVLLLILRDRLSRTSTVPDPQQGQASTLV